MTEEELLGAAGEFRSRNYSSLAAFLVLVLDHLLTFKFEYTRIWRPPFRAVNMLFIASRYLALSTHIVHYTLIHTRLANAPVPVRSCRVWISSLIMLAIVTLLILDAVLVLRIYALYQKRKQILWILVPIFAQPIAAGISVQRLLFKRDIPLDGFCNLEGSVTDAATMGSAILFSHIVLWVATFVQRNVANGHAAVVKLVVQESACALALLLAMIGATAPYTGLKHRVSPFFPLPWIVSLQCIMCCRLIMNMRRLNVESSTQNSDSQFVLSTIISSIHSDVQSCNTTSDLESPPPPLTPPLTYTEKPP